MTLTIDITPETETRLREEATFAGEEFPEYVRSLMGEKTLNLQERRKATIALLDSFMEQDEEDHKDTMACLREALNEDRPGQRRIFGEGYNPPAKADS